MFCKKCGAEVKEGSKFCGKCGTVIENETSVSQKLHVESKKSNVKMAAMILALLVLVVVGVSVRYFTSAAYKYNKTMQLAEECFLEEDYKEALEYYEELLDEDKSVAEIYVKIAEVQLAQNRIVEAFETILEGLEEAQTNVHRDILLAARKKMREQIVVVCEYENETSYVDGEVVTKTEYDTAGKKIKATKYYNGMEYLINKYDEEGMIDEKINYGSGEIQDYRNEYEYDDAGNLRKHHIYLDNVLGWMYEYDALGNQTKLVHCYPGGLPAWKEYEYDEEGVLLKETYCDYDGTVIYWYEYEYNMLGNLDEIGQLLKRTCYGADGGVDSREEYEYDEEGNLTEIVYHESGSSDYRREEYEYDKLGNQIKATMYYVTTWYNGSSERIESWEDYEYDELGNKTKYFLYEQDGTLAERYEYEYDLVGNLVKSSHYNSEGVSVWVDEYEYDVCGNKTKYICYWPDGIHSSYEYEYEYALKAETND